MSYNPAIQPDSQNTPYTVVGRGQYPLIRTTYFAIARDAVVTRRFMGKNPFWVRGLDKFVSAGRRGYWTYRSLRKYPWVRKRYIPFYPWFAHGPKKSASPAPYQQYKKYSPVYGSRYGYGRQYYYSRKGRRFKCACKCRRDRSRMYY